MYTYVYTHLLHALIHGANLRITSNSIFLCRVALYITFLIFSRVTRINDIFWVLMYEYIHIYIYI